MKDFDLFGRHGDWDKIWKILCTNTLNPLNTGQLFWVKLCQNFVRRWCLILFISQELQLVQWNWSYQTSSKHFFWRPDRPVRTLHALN